MSKKLIFLKLGGSLITDKTKPYTAKHNIITDLARQIKEALDEDNSIQLVIGNGGGSFPHYPAVTYGIKDGIKNDKHIMGFCKVQDAAAQLNRIIVAALLDVGITACSLNPSSMMYTHNGIIHDFYTKPLISLLSLGIIPVYYGDIVFDDEKGAFIVSTEMLISRSIRELRKKGLQVYKVIHNGITQGVLDDSGNIIPHISKNNIEDVKKMIHGTDGYDVTGGMLHKIEESLLLAGDGIQTVLTNGVSEENLLKRALLGQEVTGTIIK